MDEKPRMMRSRPHSMSKPALLIGLGVAIGVQVALCAVLVAIHYHDLWFPVSSNGEVEMEFVAPSEELLEELSEEKPDPMVPAVAPPTVNSVPSLIPDEELPVMELPESFPEVEDFIQESHETEFLPEELALLRLSMKEATPRKPRRKPSVPGQGDREENVTPDKKVRYKHAPSLPSSVNSSKVGKVNAVVKVVVGVNAQGEPSSVNLLHSSGNAELDRLFLRWVKENWSFYPAEKNGVPIASKVVVPVRLSID